MLRLAPTAAAVSRKRVATPITLIGVLLLVLGVGGAAWAMRGAASPIDAPLAACQASVGAALSHVGGNVKTVSGAFAVPAAKVADWQEHRGPANGPQGISPLRQLPPTQILNVCYFDGEFFAPARPPSANPRPPYDRLIVIVDDKGNVTLDTATWQHVFPIVNPASLQ